MRLLDAHCHLDLMRDARRTAADLEACDLEIFAATVMPEHTGRIEQLTCGQPRIHVAVGLHPWWITDELPASTRELLLELVQTHALVGEVGLDFSPAHRANADAQASVLEQVFTVCMEHPLPGRALSIHAVQSADVVLDLIERTGINRQATCVFHWFSGTSEELTRARRLGCRFSIGERMLASKRGRAYARAIEADRLLVETDYPVEQDTVCPARDIRDSLDHTLAQLAALRGTESEALARTLAHNAESLLGTL